MDDTDVEMNVESDENIDIFRQSVATLLSTDSSRLRLIHSGRVLQDSENLSGYSISEGSSIHAVIRPETFPSPSSQSTVPNINISNPPLAMLGGNVIVGSFSMDTEDFSENGLNNILGNLFRNQNISVPSITANPSISSSNTTGNQSGSSNVLTNSSQQLQSMQNIPATFSSTNVFPSVRTEFNTSNSGSTMISVHGFVGAIESGLGTTRNLISDLQANIGTLSVPNNLSILDASSSHQTATALSTLLWDLMTVMNSLQVPVAALSSKIKDGSFQASAQNSVDRINCQRELHRMQTHLQSLSLSAARTAEALSLVRLQPAAASDDSLGGPYSSRDAAMSNPSASVTPAQHTAPSPPTPSASPVGLGSGPAVQGTTSRPPQTVNRSAPGAAAKSTHPPAASSKPAASPPPPSQPVSVVHSTQHVLHFQPPAVPPSLRPRPPRPWHSPSDRNQRQQTVHHTVNILRQMDPAPAHLPAIHASAINLDNDLYHGALSYHEYADATTLARRIAALLERKTNEQISQQQQQHSRMMQHLSQLSAPPTAGAAAAAAESASSATVPTLAVEAPSVGSVEPKHIAKEPYQVAANHSKADRNDSACEEAGSADACYRKHDDDSLDPQDS